MNKSLLVLMRILFSTASRIVPKLTGRAAFRLLCTPFEYGKNSAKYKAIMLNAKRQFKAAKPYSITYSGGTIAAFEFLPDNVSTTDQLKTVWLIHGWQSHSLFMSHFVEPFLRLGFRVISVDLPGHGQSSGRLFHLPLAASALNATIDKLGKFDLIVAHSLGGAAVATTLAGTLPDHPTHSADKLVLISSPDSMHKIFDNFASMVGLTTKAREAMNTTVQRLCEKVPDDFATGKQLQRATTSLLLMHAPDDKEIPFSEAEAIAQMVPKATLMPMAGLGHRRIIASKDVVQAAVNFIAA